MCLNSVRAEAIHRTWGRCIGVFDTVGSLGLPEELSFGSKKIKSLFGFPDSVIGDHVERAYQALALNETRSDFVLLHSYGSLQVHPDASIELQQIQAVRRGDKEETSLETGTTNICHYTL
jgi:hypothetical protein